MNPARQTVLITRPQPEADALAAQLSLVGFHPLVDPMLSISPISSAQAALEKLMESPCQAFLLTSQHGVASIEARPAYRDLPVLAVGETTAHIAMQRGFTKVFNCEGDAATMLRAIRGQLNPNDGALIYLSGREVAHDLPALLSQHGFITHRVISYTAKESAALSSLTAAALRDKTLGHALFLSRRTAEIFITLTRNIGLEAALRDVNGFAMSEAIAHALREVVWRSVTVAPQPRMDALMQQLLIRAQMLR